MKPILSIIITATVVLTVSCGPKSGAKSTTTTDTSKPRHKLTMPQPPAMLTSDSARLDYVTAHYWDSFDRQDTTWIADTVAMEQAFADWTGVLSYQSEAKATQNITAMLQSLEVCPAMRDRLLEVAERYLYDPNSPLRNETFFIAVLQYIIKSPTIDDINKIRPRYQLDMALKNRPGAPATDFEYVLPNGQRLKLSSIKTKYTTLLFYNPECGDCARVEEYIATSPIFTQLQQNKALTVLAVYTEADIDLWRKHLDDLPKNWTIGYDKGEKITNDELYDLRAIPCLYLLDAQKRVILKDAPVEQIEAWLNYSAK